MNPVEILRLSLDALKANKLRSALTLVGIIAGVASIIAVMTGISIVQSTMEREMSVLGTTTFQVQKWPPRGFGPRDVDWQAIQRRPPITVENADIVREKVKSVDIVGAELWQFNVQASYRGEQTEGRNWIVGGTPEYPANNTHLVEWGRNISNEDVRVNRKVAVVGPSIIDQLFPFIDPIGQTIKIDGHKYQVIGVFENKSSAMGGNFDNYILVPHTAFTKQYGSRNGDGNLRSVNMTVRALHPDLVDEAIEETRGALRAARGVDPRDEDDFYIFTNDSQIKSFNQATAGVKAGAFVVGIIALIVAGIGIMNIMLVSVTERTREIGIRKALGAKRRNILAQFLTEAVLLCNFGGIVGVLVGFGLGNITTIFTGFPVHVPTEWALGGLIFCTVVGVIFGLWPAIKASRLQPVEALAFE